jgi:hypothetical protein
MILRSIFPAFVLALLFTGPASRAAETENDRKGPLAALPSSAGPHVEKIKSLGDNQWLNLGSPAPDPMWGKARGRSWSSNMPFAPDLRGMFVFGEGVHAYVKPDGHYMNDLWFYDVNAHRWICLYPGIEVKSIVQRIKDAELTVNEHGLLADAQGALLPPLLIHAYGYLGYDPDARRLAFFGEQFGNYFTTGEGGVFQTANKLFQEQRRGTDLPELSPYFYDPASGKLDCFPVKNAPRGQPYGANILVYAKSKRQFYYGGSDGVWFLDAAKRVWTSANPKGAPPVGIDQCAAYDAQRDCIYQQCRDGKTAEENFLIYDVTKNTWTRPRPRGAAPFYSSSYESVFNYDEANDRLVSIRLYDTKDEPGWRRGVYAYDPNTNTWADPIPLPQEVVRSIRNGNYGCYHPELNAWFLHFAGDSTDDGVMWGYRFRAPIADGPWSRLPQTP